MIIDGMSSIGMALRHDALVVLLLTLALEVMRVAGHGHRLPFGPDALPR